MAFPTSLSNVTDNATEILAAHINNLEAKVGIDSSAVTTSHDYKLGEVTGTDKAVGKAATQTLTNKTLTSPVINTGISGTAILDEDDMASDSATKVATQQSIKAYITSTIAAAKAALFPVGAIYTSVVSTNPATLLGFGTWAAFGAGRTLVGIDAGQTEFDVVEETGGAKTHTLTEAEMPEHDHAVTDPGHFHTVATSSGDTTGSGYIPNNSTPGTPSVNTDSKTTGITVGNAGSGSAHNNLQPYIVVYFWKRTA